MSTIQSAIRSYLDSVRLARSQKTHDTYDYALRAFSQALTKHHLPPEESSPSQLPEDAIVWLANALKDHSPATESLYLTAVAGFYEYLSAENLAAPNLPRLRLLIRRRSRKTGQRLPQFPADSIVKILDYATLLVNTPVENDDERLRNLRDRAFLLALADTGLRVHEACKLRRGDMDWNEGRAQVIGKGDQQAIVRFSGRALKALKEYLAQRAGRDGATGRPLPSLPLFARHDKGAGAKTKPMTTTTGRNIVAQRVAEALGQEAVGTITPHSFRHFFVTTVLKSSQNLKLAQELARHKNISVTQRYAHLSNDELDKGYWGIFDDDG